MLKTPYTPTTYSLSKRCVGSLSIERSPLSKCSTFHISSRVTTGENSVTLRYCMITPIPWYRRRNLPWKKSQRKMFKIRTRSVRRRRRHFWIYFCRLRKMKKRLLTRESGKKSTRLCLRYFVSSPDTYKEVIINFNRIQVTPPRLSTDPYTILPAVGDFFSNRESFISWIWPNYLRWDFLTSTSTESTFKFWHILSFLILYSHWSLVWHTHYNSQNLLIRDFYFMHKIIRINIPLSSNLPQN